MKDILKLQALKTRQAHLSDSIALLEAELEYDKKDLAKTVAQISELLSQENK